MVFQNRASHLQYLSSEASFDFWELMIFLVCLCSWPGLTHKTRDPVILPGQLSGRVL